MDMEITTKFSPRDRVWYINGNKMPEQGTIGQVRVELTDSEGMSEDTIFDNYKPQKERVEQYMLVETGIGSGRVYTLDVHVFATESECAAKIEEAKATA